MSSLLHQRHQPIIAPKFQDQAPARFVTRGHRLGTDRPLPIAPLRRRVHASG
jgi:hypothetical protein